MVTQHDGTPDGNNCPACIQDSDAAWARLREIWEQLPDGHTLELFCVKPGADNPPGFQVSIGVPSGDWVEAIGDGDTVGDAIDDALMAIVVGELPGVVATPPLVVE